MDFYYFVNGRLQYQPNILSMEALEGRVQLKIENCLFSLWGTSFRPPPGWIIAAKNWTSTMLVNSPGFSRLKKPFHWWPLKRWNGFC